MASITLIMGVLVGLTLGINREGLATPDATSYNTYNNEIAFTNVLSTNFVVVVFLSVGGLLSVGLFSVFTLLITGMQLGMAFYVASLSDPKLILLLLPHGIIEIVGLVTASSVGIKPFFIVYEHLKTNKEALGDYMSKEKITQTLSLILTAVLLILVAAFIESFLTGGILLRSLTP